MSLWGDISFVFEDICGRVGGVARGERSGAVPASVGVADYCSLAFSIAPTSGSTPHCCWARRR